ncbi:MULTISPECIES: hypothetical protein [unclassified Luteococcus]|uniref:hypothetical protein n=1 Tax=unclassified Luteococcus TaxID=2639923 RepID=UPI00313EF569
MIRKFAATLGAVALSATFCSALPAQAATPVTVSSPSCNTIRVANSQASTWVVSLDSGDEIRVPAKATLDVRVDAGGDYIWDAAPDQSDAFTATYRVSVAACTGTPARPLDGDQNKDRKADVLGIQASTGDLYYYRMTTGGLAGGIKAGNGWNRMVFMQQVNEIEGAGTPNYLIAVRDDGTVWRYNNLGYGKFSNGTQIGSGLKGYTNFTITQTNNMLAFGGHVLLATKGDTLYGIDLGAGAMAQPAEITTGWQSTVKLIAMRDFDGNNEGDLISIRSDGTMWFHKVMKYGPSVFAAPKQVGSGWGRMQTVTSPGAVDADKLSDLISRRSDGNLYKYLNQGSKFGLAIQIGQNWNRIRLLA